MRTENIRQNFHKLIDELKDETLLQHIYEMMLELSKTNSDKDILDELTDEQKSRLMKSIESYKQGKTHTLSQVKEEVAKWLTK